MVNTVVETVLKTVFENEKPLLKREIVKKRRNMLKKLVLEMKNCG